jgi:hypothetical protein
MLMVSSLPQFTLRCLVSAQSSISCTVFVLRAAVSCWLLQVLAVHLDECIPQAGHIALMILRTTVRNNRMLLVDVR